MYNSSSLFWRIMQMTRNASEMQDGISERFTGLKKYVVRICNGWIFKKVI